MYLALFRREIGVELSSWRAVSRNWITSLPTDRAAGSCTRCSGVPASGGIAPMRPMNSPLRTSDWIRARDAASYLSFFAAFSMPIGAFIAGTEPAGCRPMSTPNMKA